MMRHERDYMNVNSVSDVSALIGGKTVNVKNPQERGISDDFRDIMTDMVDKVNIGNTDIKNYHEISDDSDKISVTADSKENVNEVQNDNENKEGYSLSVAHKDVADGRKEDVSSSNELKDEIIGEAAKKLGISEDELVNILSDLGIGAADLCNGENISLVVADIFSQGDITGIVTDENLSSLVKELTAMINDIINTAADDLGIAPLQLKEMLSDEAFELHGEVSENETDTDNSGVINGKVTTDYVAKDADISAGHKNYSYISEEKNDSLLNYSENTDSVGTNSENYSSEDDYSNDGSFEDRAKREIDHDTKDAEKNSLNNGLNGDNTFNINEVATDKIQLQENVRDDYVREQAEIINQIRDHIRTEFKSDLTSLEMQLNPENLGTVNLSVTGKAGGEVSVFLTTQNEAVQSALQAQIDMVRESLELQGVKVQAIEVAVASHSFEQNLEQGNDENDAQTDVNENLKKATRRLNINGILTDEDIEGLDEADVVTAKMMQADGNSLDYKA